MRSVVMSVLIDRCASVPVAANALDEPAPAQHYRRQGAACGPFCSLAARTPPWPAHGAIAMECRVECRDGRILQIEAAGRAFNHTRVLDPRDQPQLPATA